MPFQTLIVFKSGQRFWFETTSHAKFLISNPLQKEQGDLLKRLEHGQIVTCEYLTAKEKNFVVKINKVIDQYTNRVIETF
jgi:hypothetical protein